MANKIIMYSLSIPWGLLRRKDITGDEKICYMTLMDDALHDDGSEEKTVSDFALPILENLAEDLGCTPDQIQKQLDRLVETNYLEKGKSTVGHKLRYYILEHEWMTSNITKEEY